MFVGGVSLGQPATAIPLAAVAGLVCGLICGFLIYSFASRTSKFLTGLSGGTAADHVCRPALTVFLVVMTNFILLIGAGLFSRAIGSFQEQIFNNLCVSPHSHFFGLLNVCPTGSAVMSMIPAQPVTAPVHTTSAATSGT